MNFQPEGASFCDWLTVSQIFPEGLPPEIIDKQVTHNERTGELLFEKYEAVDTRGSFETNIRVKATHDRLTLSGNIGRFDRPDNVFGYSLDQCKVKANQFLKSLDLGLPEFSAGKWIDLQSKSSRRSQVYTGALISRVDMTTNFSMGDDAADFMHWLGSQKISRSKNTAYEGECVYWGSINYALSKCYLKSEEIKKSVQRNKRRGMNATYEHTEYLKKLEKYASDIGMVRHEVRFSERFLNQKKLKPWTTTHEILTVEYLKELKKMTERCEINKSIGDVSKAAKSTYYDYINGVNVKGDLTRATFYRHRKELLDLGVDIAEATNVRALSVRPKLVEIKPAAIPSFYQRPQLRSV